MNLDEGFGIPGIWALSNGEMRGLQGAPPRNGPMRGRKGAETARPALELCGDLGWGPGWRQGKQPYGCTLRAHV